LDITRANHVLSHVEGIASMKSKIRSSKSEIRNKFKCSKEEKFSKRALPDVWVIVTVGFVCRMFVSDFDIRISDFLNFARFAFFARDLSI
jgi:pyridoxine/pyridoxamine 5'-phosphate oxidase